MSRKDKKNESIWPLVILSVIVCGFWGLSWILICVIMRNWSDRGTFGDMFGAINSLFSGLAFAGVIYTIVLQRKELSLQRDEISKSTKELEGQKNLMDLQNFENKFFQLINLHHEIVKSSKSGRGLFNYVASVVYNTLDGEELTITELNNTYLKMYNEYKAELGHYFRNLFHIVKFVDSTSELKDFYTRYSYLQILRAQLSTYEIVLLAYNGLSIHGHKFKELIEKYKLLKNIDFNDDILIDSKFLLKQYSHLDEAYREQMDIK